jgi:hypothetical protein
MVEKICLVCNSTFYADSHRNKFCSITCKSIHKRQYNKNYSFQSRKNPLIHAKLRAYEKSPARLFQKRKWALNYSRRPIQIMKQKKYLVDKKHYSKEYYSKNRDICNTNAKLRYHLKKLFGDGVSNTEKEKLIEESKIKRINYIKEYKQKSLVKLRNRVGVGIYHSLRRINAEKLCVSWEKLLGYTKEQLCEHLSKQFSPNMSWDNYGSFWQIDHVVPISWFKTKKQQLKHGWALKNLQPLELQLNNAKSNLYVGNPKAKLGVIFL